jgi:dTDP-4-dehydrorhamnose reductase
VKKILVTGSNGLLGSNLVYHAADRYEVVASSLTQPVSCKPVGKISLDITDVDLVTRVVKQLHPEIIFHCAAETGVDFCEENPGQAEVVNIIGTQNVVRAAENIDALVVYISSDSAFDGERGGYAETDEPNPVNIYSKTKVEGEHIVTTACLRHLLVRTNVFGWNMLTKLSLSEWILTNLRNGKAIKGFQDVIFGPLIVNDLAEILFDMCEDELYGLYHVGTTDHVSKYEFAVSIADIFGLDSSLILPSKLASMPFKAPRPKVTYLNVNLVEKAMGRAMPTVAEELRRFYMLEQSGYVEELKSAVKKKVKDVIP